MERDGDAHGGRGHRHQPVSTQGIREEEQGRRMLAIVCMTAATLSGGAQDRSSGAAEEPAAGVPAELLPRAMSAACRAKPS